MKFKYLVLPFLCAIVSCGEASKSSSSTDSTGLADIVISNVKEPSNDVDKAIRITDTTGDVQEKVFNGTPTAIEWDKKIIKTANIEAECKAYSAFNRNLHAMVKQHGGWIASEAESDDNGHTRNSVTIKVPVYQFEDMVNNIGNGEVRVIRKSITTEDVTGTIVDAEGRVKVKKAMRDKYLAMLTETKKMSDVLDVQAKIDDIHEEIELSANRVNALQHQSAYSTINISYYEPATGAAITDNTPGIGGRILYAAKGGATWIGDILVALISVWPLLLLAFVAYYFVRKRMAKNVRAAGVKIEG